MRKSDDTLDAYQIPETDAEFKEMEKDAQSVTDAMRKWGWTRIQMQSPDDGPVFVKPGSGRCGPFSRMRIDFYNEANPTRIIEPPQDQND